MELLVLGGAQIEKYNTNNYKYYCSMSKVQKLKANTIILIIISYNNTMYVCEYDQYN